MSTEGFDPLMDILENANAQLLIHKIAKEAAEHVLMRVGINAGDPDSAIQVQSDMAFIRQHRLSAALMQQDIIEMKSHHKMHESEDARQFSHIVSNQNIAAQDRSTMHSENKKALKELTEANAAAIAGLTARIDRMYGRSWAVAILIMGLLGSGLLYFVTRYLEAHP